VAVGLTLLEQKKVAEAESLLASGCREIADHLSQAPEYEFAHLSRTFEALIGVYRNSNRPEKAAEWLAVKRNAFDLLIRKQLSADKISANGVKLLRAIIQDDADAGRTADAVKLADTSIAERRTRGWPTDAAGIAACGDLIAAVINAGRPELGIELGRAVLAELGKQAKPSADLLVTTQCSLGLAELAARKHADAEASLREALRLQDTADPKDWKSAKLRLWLRQRHFGERRLRTQDVQAPRESPFAGLSRKENAAQLLQRETSPCFVT
jgi:hypothetical protein